MTPKLSEPGCNKPGWDLIYRSNRLPSLSSPALLLKIHNKLNTINKQFGH
jgi:hypothetical protein